MHIGNSGPGTVAMLWEWHYLIFILPFAVGALLLLLSSLRFGGHGHHSFGHQGGHRPLGSHGIGGATAAHSAHATSVTHAAVGHAAAGHAAAHPHSPASHRGATGSQGGGGAKAASGVTPLTVTLLLLGIGRAPLPLVIEFFLICWGIAGFWSVGNLVHAPHPGFFQMVPSLVIAFVSGVIGSRIAAEVVGRIMPKEESSVVSADALYGLTGTVTYPVSQTGGRVHIYDEFGTLHDESCRVTVGHSEIAKGSTVMIADRDTASGRLIVELSPTQPRHKA